jgi:hypothetical protein
VTEEEIHNLPELFMLMGEIEKAYTLIIEGSINARIW